MFFLIHLFGIKEKEITGETVQDVCPQCGQYDHRTFGIKRHFYAFWIPFFPTSLKPGMECIHCKHTRVGKELDDGAAYQIKRNIFTRRQVLPLFAGSFLALLFVLWVVGALQHEDSMTQSYLAEPKVHDYYVVRVPDIFDGADPEKPYRILKIVDITPEGISFAVGNYVYEWSSDAKDAIRSRETEENSYFNPKQVFLNDRGLDRMRQSDAVRWIKRH